MIAEGQNKRSIAIIFAGLFIALVVPELGPPQAIGNATALRDPEISKIFLWILALCCSFFGQAKNTMLSEPRGSITIFAIDCAYLRRRSGCRSLQGGDAAEHASETCHFRGNRSLERFRHA
jgi:hypothetical protein